MNKQKERSLMFLYLSFPASSAQHREHQQVHAFVHISRDLLCWFCLHFSPLFSFSLCLEMHVCAETNAPYWNKEELVDSVQFLR